MSDHVVKPASAFVMRYSATILLADDLGTCWRAGRGVQNMAWVNLRAFCLRSFKYLHLEFIPCYYTTILLNKAQPSRNLLFLCNHWTLIANVLFTQKSIPCMARKFILKQAGTEKSRELQSRSCFRNADTQQPGAAGTIL